MEVGLDGGVVMEIGMMDGESDGGGGCRRGSLKMGVIGGEGGGGGW